MRALTLNPQAIFKKSASKNSNKPTKPQQVSYGRDWYAQTREAANPKQTVREQLEYRRKANREANNGLERKDLYTDNWAGDKYTGSPVNVLTIIAAISVVAPIVGLVFAFQTYGVLWG